LNFGGNSVITPASITIDIVSDVVCPWCVIGYRQLERAVGIMADRVYVGVRWHPFQLAPTLPPEGQTTRDYVRERYGATPEQSRSNRAQITSLGATLGIDFRFDDDSRIYNTHRAHQLLAWAGEAGGQTALKLALFEACFTAQLNVSDTDVLLAAAEAAGLNPDAARAVLEDRRYAAAVDAEIAHWQDQNITGVPAFIVNGGYMVPGAQDAETWVSVLERVIEKELA
jgi:predicted DsbA family dithiol-disulfide isomerase